MAPVLARLDGGGGGSGHTVTWAINGLVVVLAVVSTTLRFYTRIFTRAGLKADDWLILGALITALTVVVLVVWGNSADPNGLRMSENTDPNYHYTPQDHLYLKLSFTCSVLYFTVSGATKLGILLMYHRIFAISTSFRYLLYVSSALVTGWWIGCTIAALRKCDSLEFGLASTLNDPRHCFDFNVFWLASGICEILLDVLILTLPVAVVVRMRYSLKRKLMMSGIFLLGAFVIVTGIVKVKLAYTPGKRSLSYASAELWAALHSSMAILCASLPIFRPLVKRVASSHLIVKFSRLLPRRRQRSGSSTTSDGSDEAEKNNDNNRPNRSLAMSFIASEMVLNLLKRPEEHTSEPRPLDKANEGQQDQVPQLPRIDTTGTINLFPDSRLERSQHGDEIRGHLHSLEGND
ncbi:hypothetical protein GGR52DRAFT_207730 [Hypoxylon sp. FL1284]|nr:hypothetical protein GGR52DRAFT_207730 [Hypoxylon sp. FL1284]